MMYFLSGLPRSGSTVLAALLNQNPKFHVTATSGLIDIMGSVVQKWESDPSVNAQVKDENEIFRLLKGIVKAKYENIQNPIVIDKSRGWPNPVIIETMNKVMGTPPKIIATVRNVPDCAASFVRVVKPENINDFLINSFVIEHLKSSYINLKAGYDKYPEFFCIVEYENLLANPAQEIKKIHAFLGLEDFEYDFNKIDGSSVAEKDEEVWKIPGLHNIQPKLEKQHNQNSKDVLGIHYPLFLQPRFWDGEVFSDIPKQPLDLQLEASKRGDFEKAKAIAAVLEKTEPDNNRAAYNRGLYVLMDGNLQEGMRLLTRGRFENVFGDRKPNTPRDIWSGTEKGTVVLRLEGGLGDQIHQVRFAQDIVGRGCKAIVSCHPSLINLFSQLPHVSAVITQEAIGSVYHDFWVPAMTAPLSLGIEYKDVLGGAYIQKPESLDKKKFRIGLRWQGNHLFEHDHNKYFDPKLLFGAVAGRDVEFVSLQRDEGAQHRPEWIVESNLNSWEDTQVAVASCDLVISSCTSVAHLSGAMGIPTWVVTPLLPYYVWATPGEKCPWYDSIRLFRQTKFEDWSEVFIKLSCELDLHLKGIGYVKTQSVR
jgi:hypothetical protein